MKLYVFNAKWCGPCNQLAAQLVNIPHEEIDVDKDSELMLKYAIRAVPSLVLADESGDVLDIRVGYMDKVAIQKWLNIYGG